MSLFGTTKKRRKTGPTLLKHPKKPKKGSTVAAKEKYLSRVNDVEKENAKRKRDWDAKKKKAKELDAKIYR